MQITITNNFIQAFFPDSENQFLEENFSDLAGVIIRAHVFMARRNFEVSMSDLIDNFNPHDIDYLFHGNFFKVVDGDIRFGRQDMIRVQMLQEVKNG
jgi:hypothetical protein